MDTVLVTGGTGLIGRNLCKRLIEKGYDVALLSTSGRKAEGLRIFPWNPDAGRIDANALTGVDYIVHLAGANIGAKRWTPQRKKEIVNSRVKSGELLFLAWQDKPGKLKTFITASATGYYGALTSNKIFTEDDPPANDFPGETCRNWENVSDLFAKAGIRSVKIRTGVVLDRDEGALARLLMPIKLNFGSALGTGRQFMPWIHMDDICGIYLKAIEDNAMEGAYNAVASRHVTNEEFTRIVAEVSGKTIWMPNVPAFVIKAVFGEMAAIVLEGSRVSAEKITKAGYSFRFPELKPALENILKH